MYVTNPVYFKWVTCFCLSFGGVAGYWCNFRPGTHGCDWNRFPQNTVGALIELLSSPYHRYLDYIRDTVYRSLPQAKLGGRPGTYELVRSYLNIRQVGRNPALEDGGKVGGQPLWPMVFYCLRCGDLEDAYRAVSEAGWVGHVICVG